MKTLKTLTILPLLAGLALSACNDNGPAAPAFDEELLSLEEELTLELLNDPVALDVALSLGVVQDQAAQRFGKRWGQNGGNTLAQAENAFRNAQGALAQGDQHRALEQARLGRELVAQAILNAGGPMALQGMVERLHTLPLSVTASPDCFGDAQRLSQNLQGLAAGAGNQWGKGNRIKAGGLGVLGEQAVRRQLRDSSGVFYQRPDLWVELGEAGIALSASLLAENGGGDADQLAAFATAEEYQAQAVAALEAGTTGRTVHSVHLALSWALNAVILPGGITTEDGTAILAKARELYDAAVVAVGAAPTELQAGLLLKASDMLAAGANCIESGSCRGLGATWQSAAISFYLAN